jgi:hypothetical protein
LFGTIFRQLVDPYFCNISPINAEYQNSSQGAWVPLLPPAARVPPNATSATKVTENGETRTCTTI